MAWLEKKRTDKPLPWLERKKTDSVPKNAEDSLSRLESKLKNKLDAWEREREEEKLSRMVLSQPSGDANVFFVEEINADGELRNPRITSIEREKAGLPAHTFTIGFPFSGSEQTEFERENPPADFPENNPTHGVISDPPSSSYRLESSTLFSREENLDEDIQPAAPPFLFFYPETTSRPESGANYSIRREKISAAPENQPSTAESYISDSREWEEETEESHDDLTGETTPEEEEFEKLEESDFEEEEEEENDEEITVVTAEIQQPSRNRLSILSEEEEVAESFSETPAVPVKMVPLLKDAPAQEWASSTPVIKFDRQYKISFQNLSTSRKDENVLDPKESQKVISILEETLDQFGIEGRVIGIQRGPIITRYELKMAPGIKVSRILGLCDELAMALEAIKVRIEAPIPGRSSVGIEIPNRKRARVLLGDIITEPAFREFEGALTLPLGKDIAGNLMLTDLVKMPHLLIAGATGSGKSVLVNSFITNAIMHKSPEEIRLMLIDPKLVELSHFNDIPHLLHPVITEPQKAVLALNWAVEEMERRYEDMAELRARDIRTYNEKIQKMRESGDKKIPPKMPYILLLIDELGDLMMVAGKEVEGSIIRLSQKARAIGIHLILATQRPSVDVITALIKANCPARIALQVAQKTDSRTILDANGAEQLLGQGDMLFKHPSKGQLIRIQAPLITDEEVDQVVKNAKNLGKPVYIRLEDPKAKASQVNEEDEGLFDEAWAIILESGKASASYLQRRLRIGYNRAARLIEAFEARGLIGPQIGSKPRDILVNSALS